MSYTYRVISDFRAGMPQTPTGTVGPFLCIALHDTEGGVGYMGALGTIRFLIDNPSRNASYHELWAWDEATRAFTAIRIVPSTSAAHSINPYPPSKGGSYEPDAVVREALGARVNDPNRVVYAVSIAGRKADVNRWAADDEFVAACARRLKELRESLKIPERKAEHFRFNPSTRTDWGGYLTPKIDGMEEMKFRNPIVTEEWTTIAGTASTFWRPDGSTGYFTSPERVRSVAEGTFNGVDVRLLDYGPDHEALMIQRKGINPIPGTRIVGLPADRTAEVNALNAQLSAKNAGLDRIAAAVSETRNL